MYQCGSSGAGGGIFVGGHSASESSRTGSTTTLRTRRAAASRWRRVARARSWATSFRPPPQPRLGAGGDGLRHQLSQPHGHQRQHRSGPEVRGRRERRLPPRPRVALCRRRHRREHRLQLLRLRRRSAEVSTATSTVWSRSTSGWTSTRARGATELAARAAGASCRRRRTTAGSRARTTRVSVWFCDARSAAHPRCSCWAIHARTRRSGPCPSISCRLAWPVAGCGRRCC